MLKTPPNKLFRCDVKTAMDEIGDSTQTLIHAPGNGDLDDDVVDRASDKRADVAKLYAFRKHLEAQQQRQQQQQSGGAVASGSGGQRGQSRRHQLLKINMAVSVLYARKVLAALLAHWPFPHDGDEKEEEEEEEKERLRLGRRRRRHHYHRAITAELLSCKDEQQIPCVLDLLQKSQPSESFRKVVKNVIRMCHPKCLLPMAITACHFMEEITFHSVTKESEHGYQSTSQVEEKVPMKVDQHCLIKESTNVYVDCSI